MFGRVTYAPGSRFGPRVQTHYQLVLMEEGAAQVQLADGATLTAAAGEALLLLPGGEEYFEFSDSVRTVHSWLHLPPEFAPADLRQRLHRGPRRAPLTRGLRAVVRAGLAQNGRLQEAAILAPLAHALMEAYLTAAAGARDPEGHPPPAIERAVDFIENHLAAPIHLPEIATAAGVSPQHLMRLFRSHLGHSPMRLLWKLRTERGADLLAGTGLSVTEIARASGFASQAHFSRCLRRQYGQSPLEWRRHWWRRREPIPPSP